MNWHTKSQGPKKKCIHFSMGRINPAPPTPPIVRVVLLHKKQIVQRMLSSTVYGGAENTMYYLLFAVELLSAPDSQQFGLSLIVDLNLCCHRGDKMTLITDYPLCACI